MNFSSLGSLGSLDSLGAFVLVGAASFSFGSFLDPDFFEGVGVVAAAFDGVIDPVLKISSISDALVAVVEKQEQKVFWDQISGNS